MLFKDPLMREKFKIQLFEKISPNFSDQPLSSKSSMMIYDFAKG